MKKKTLKLLNALQFLRDSFVEDNMSGRDNDKLISLIDNKLTKILKEDILLHN